MMQFQYLQAIFNALEVINEREGGFHCEVHRGHRWIFPMLHLSVVLIANWTYNSIVDRIRHCNAKMHKFVFPCIFKDVTLQNIYVDDTSFV